MQFKVTNSLISFSSHGDALTESIAFQVKPEGRDRISIADKYVFGDQYPSKDREEVSGRLTIEKLNDSHSSYYKLDENKLGVTEQLVSHYDIPMVENKLGAIEQLVSHYDIPMVENKLDLDE
jgi:phosphoribulokinase